MIIRPEKWWFGDRLKARIFVNVRQLIFDTKITAYQAAPRRKTDITNEVAEAAKQLSAEAYARIVRWSFSNSQGICEGTPPFPIMRAR